MHATQIHEAVNITLISLKRWKEMWTKHLQSAIFAAALVEFLDTGKLISMPAANDVLGSPFLHFLAFGASLCLKSIFELT